MKKSKLIIKILLGIVILTSISLYQLTKYIDEIEYQEDEWVERCVKDDGSVKFCSALSEVSKNPKKYPWVKKIKKSELSDCELNEAAVREDCTEKYYSNYPFYKFIY